MASSSMEGVLGLSSNSDVSIGLSCGSFAGGLVSLGCSSATWSCKGISNRKRLGFSQIQEYNSNWKKTLVLNLAALLIQSPKNWDCL